MVHFQFIFLEHMRCRLWFISLPTNVHLFSHRLLRRFSFLHWAALTSSANTSWAYLCGLFLGSPFCCIGLCVYPSASSIQSQLQQLYNDPNVIIQSVKKWSFELNFCLTSLSCLEDPARDGTQVRVKTVAQTVLSPATAGSPILEQTGGWERLSRPPTSHRVTVG